MAKRDTKKVAKYARDAYEWSVDIKPKGQRKQKRKERQDGKKEIRQSDRQPDYDPREWTPPIPELEEKG